MWTRPSSAPAAPVSPRAPWTGADARGAPRRLATALPSLPSGSAMAQAAQRGGRLVGGGPSRRADEGHEDLLAEQARVVDVAGGAPAVGAVAVDGGHGPCRPGHERAAGDDPSVDGPSAPSAMAPSTTAAAPAPVVVSPAVPSPGTSASEATTSATRAWPAASASQAPRSASIPACGDPLSSAPPTAPSIPNVAARKAWLGPSAKGGRAVPHHRPDTSSGADARPRRGRRWRPATPG